MKIGIVGDVHWCKYSSILRSRGQKFSIRLEHLIKSLNWVESTFKEKGCEKEIFLGDFFDTSSLDEESITALSKINWNKNTLKHFIVGNHESGVASLEYNSTQVLNKVGSIESTPNIYPICDVDLLFLPYITEDERKPLKEYLINRNTNNKLVVFSHNDIKDFQMGSFLSKTGFSIKDIEDNCDLYINGHLHNGGWVTNKILNLGNICGQNFNECGFKYEHHIAILDTDTLELEFIENPYALNFYKIEIKNNKDLNLLNLIKNNSVLSIRCNSTLVDKVKELVTNNSKICMYKLIIYEEDTNEEKLVEERVELKGLDYIDKFKEFIQANLGNDSIVMEELSEVCK